MENIVVNGLVIKETKYGEGNKILTILTDSLGKIKAAANGVRSYKSKISSGSGLFCFSKFLLKEGREMYSVVSADTICNFFEISQDFEKLTYATYFFDLVSAVTVEDEASEILRLILNTLYFVENTGDLLLSKPVFELRLMKECGFMPQISCCNNCGSNEGLSYFSVEDGVTYCGGCANKRNMDDTVAVAIKYILNAEQKKIFSFNITKDTLTMLSDISEKYVINQLGNVPKSLIYLKTNI